MLKVEEKAYCRALKALQEKDYVTADKEFETCKPLFAGNRGYEIVFEATRLLVYLRNEKEKRSKMKTKIKEAHGYGKETIICGQGEQEETC